MTDIDWTLHRQTQRKEPPSGTPAALPDPRESPETHSTSAQVWRKASLQPHRSGGSTASNDPDFEAKAADVIGLHRNPPVYAPFSLVDENKRHSGTGPARPRPARFRPAALSANGGFGYYCDGTPSLYAALDVRTGPGGWKDLRRSHQRGIVALLADVVATELGPTRKSTSSWTTFPLIRRRESPGFWPSIRNSLSMILRPTLPG